MPRADHLPPGAVKLLKEPQLGHVVTLMPDGSPQITVVWIDAEDDGGHVLVNTGTRRQKLRNVGRDRRVAVSVVDKDDPWRWVVVRGEVVEVTNEGAEEHIDTLAQKYMGRLYPNHNPDDPRVLWKIKPTSVTTGKVDQ